MIESDDVTDLENEVNTAQCFSLKAAALIEAEIKKNRCSEAMNRTRQTTEQLFAKQSFIKPKPTALNLARKVLVITRNGHSLSGNVS